MKKYLGSSFIFFSAVFWGSSGIFVNTLKEFGISGIGIVFGRAVFTVLILGLGLLIFDRKAFIIKRRDLWICAVIGIASIVFFNYCYYKTMGYTGLSVAAVLMYTAPVFVMIISVLFLGERLSLIKVLSCLVAIVGCAFVTGLIGTGASLNAPGLIFGICTAFGYSLYGIFSSILVKKGYKTTTITFYSFVFAVLGSAVVVGRELPGVCQTFFSGTVPFVTIVLMSLINTIIPYILYSSGLKTVRPSTAIIIATVEPIVATIFDITVYKKFPSVFAYFGMVLILSAVLVLNLFGNGENERNETARKR
ncbi:MAG: EamA family transporter [Clostridia bacterium]|nr:EamA family transporter [Clostridia bacterium]